MMNDRSDELFAQALDPDDLERCISPKTKAIMVVHYSALPCDMDRIMAIADKHGIKVNVWTVNKPETVNKLLRMGVDGIITDVPQMVNALVERFEG